MPQTQPGQSTTQQYAEATTPQPNEGHVVNDDDDRTVLVAGTTLTCVGVAPHKELMFDVITIVIRVIVLLVFAFVRGYVFY